MNFLYFECACLCERVDDGVLCCLRIVNVTANVTTYAYRYFDEMGRFAEKATSVGPAM